VKRRETVPTGSLAHTFFTSDAARNDKSTKTMTIKIQREALVSVINRAPSWTFSTCKDMLISYDDEFVLVNLPGKSPCLESPEHRRSYSDEDSLCTSSTLSLSSSESLSTERRVSFAPCLVTDEWVRPFTPPEEVSTLHYSIEDTSRYVRMLWCIFQRLFST
jgi:hypothetical protein